MEAITNFSDLDITKKYTYSDYLKWNFKERVELIKGFISKMSPAPSRFHQEVSQNLSGCFYENFKRQSCRVFVAPFDVRLQIKNEKKDETVVQPDLCIVCDENKLDDKGCNGSPDLIVEIISPNNSKHDIHTKFNLYQEAGVQEYWIVDPTDKLILIYTLDDRKYIGLPPLALGDVVKSPLFPNMKVALDDVFYRI
ncbi:MAG: Uma2 family endonuclease [Flavobacterium sp.]